MNTEIEQRGVAPGNRTAWIRLLAELILRQLDKEEVEDQQSATEIQQAA